MKKWFLPASAIFALFLLTSAYGQGIYLESVEGLAGSAEDSTILCDGSTEIVFNLRLVGTTEISRGLTAGFRIYSDNDATWTSIVLDTLAVGISWSEMWQDYDSVGGFFVNYFSATGSGADTVGVGAIGIVGGLSPDFDAVAFSITIGPIASEHAGKTICLDSCFYPPFGYWMLAGLDGDFEWSGPHHFTLGTLTDVKDAGSGLPKRFALEQNYPNPFNPSTEIMFDVPTRSRVELSIFNVLGQRVRTLVDEELAPGSYSRIWDGKGDGGESLSTGIYLYRLEADEYTQSRKMILLK